MGLGEQFGNVHYSKRLAVTANQTVQMHQAGHIDSGEHFGAGLLVLSNAVPAHHAGDGFLIDGKRPAKPATLIGSRRLRQYDLIDSFQKTASLVEVWFDSFARGSQPQFPQTVTTLMQPDPMRKPSPDPLNLQHVGQKFAQFEGLAFQIVEARETGKIFVVMAAHHCRAASRRTDDVFILAEDVQKPMGQWAGLFDAAGIGHRLTTAGLRRRKIDLHAMLLEHPDRRHSDVRIELIDVTGDEQSNPHEGDLSTAVRSRMNERSHYSQRSRG